MLCFYLFYNDSCENKKIGKRLIGCNVTLNLSKIIRILKVNELIQLLQIVNTSIYHDVDQIHKFNKKKILTFKEYFYNTLGTMFDILQRVEGPQGFLRIRNMLLNRYWY